jgi:hypothetical protein
MSRSVTPNQLAICHSLAVCNRHSDCFNAPPAYCTTVYTLFTKNVRQRSLLRSILIFVTQIEYSSSVSGRLIAHDPADIIQNPVRALRTTHVAGALFASMIFILAPLASAGTIGISDGKLIVGTEPGDGSQAISASIVGTNLVISGVNFDIVTPGCTGVGDVTCALSGFNELIVLGGAGDDVISLGAISAPTFSTLILGGPGDDVLIGSGGDDTIFGGPGDDILIGGPGIDCLVGGPGNNVQIQAPRSSCFNGPDPVITPLPRVAAATPEPSALWLMGTGLAVLPLTRRKLRERRKHQTA